MGHAVERAVELRLREEQRDAGKDDEQVVGKGREYFSRRQPGDEDANDPGEGDGQYADVQLRRAADDHDDDQCAQGSPCEHQEVPPRTSSESSSTAGWSAGESAKS
jgi:hypothetical protein